VNFYQTTQPGSGAVAYDGGYPWAVSRGRVKSQPDNINQTAWQPNTDPALMDLTRWVDPTTGGATGTVARLGWTTGLKAKPWLRFDGSAARAVRRDLSKDTTGPVGRNNHAGVLAAGVAEQYAVPPTLEQIYRSFTQPQG
jgi:hypothetical protein